MNLVEKLGAACLLGISGTFALLTAVSSSSQDEPTLHVVSHEEAQVTCGGHAELDTKVEDVGDGHVETFDIYECPDGREIPVIDWR